MLRLRMSLIPIVVAAVAAGCSDMPTDPTDDSPLLRLFSTTSTRTRPTTDSIVVGNVVHFTHRGTPLEKVAHTTVAVVGPDRLTIQARKAGRTIVSVRVNNITERVPVVVHATATIGPADVTSLPDRVEPDPVPEAIAPPTLAAGSAPEAPRLRVDLTVPTVSGRSIPVRTSAELSAALASARGGDEIVLADRVIFDGNFRLPRRADGGTVIIRSETVAPVGRRVTPATAAGFAKIRTPNADPALITDAGASGYFITSVEFSVAPVAPFTYNIITLGHSERSLADQPSRIVLDRVYIHSIDGMRVQRCVGLQGRYQAVVNSWLSACHSRGEDAQAIGGWLGAGPFHIENNHLEGSGQVVMFGGGDPLVVGTVPSDIIVRRNHMMKPLSWAGVWSIKNLFQLKSGRRLVFENNVLENNWIESQVGWAIMMWSGNQNGGSPTSAVQDILIQNNIIRNSTGGINIAGSYPGTAPEAILARVAIRNNLFQNVGTDPINGATGRFMQLTQEAGDVSVVGNTFSGSRTTGAAIFFDGTPVRRFDMRQNLFHATEYGFFGSGVGEGNPAISRYAPDAVVTSNTFVGRSGGSYPAGNAFPASLASSTLRYSEGTVSSGVDMATLTTATAGVVVAP